MEGSKLATNDAIDCTGRMGRNPKKVGSSSSEAGMGCYYRNNMLIIRYLPIRSAKPRYRTLAWSLDSVNDVENIISSLIFSIGKHIGSNGTETYLSESVYPLQQAARAGRCSAVVARLSWNDWSTLLPRGSMGSEKAGLRFTRKRDLGVLEGAIDSCLRHASMALKSLVNHFLQEFALHPAKAVV